MHFFSPQRGRVSPFYLLRLSLSLLLCLSLSPGLYSQSHPLGSWNILNGKLTINQHWSVWAEGQMRSTAFMHDFNYFEIKGGVNYHISKSFSFTAGLGRL
jgi:hypothetical protein